MVLGPVIVQVAKTVFKYRKYIYRTLVAQDRAIDKAFRIGGYGRQARRGVRHGALAGSVIGTIIGVAPDTPGNGVQTPFRKLPKTNPQDQTRRRYSGGYTSGRNRNQEFNREQRCPSPSKYYRSRNRFYR